MDLMAQFGDLESGTMLNGIIGINIRSFGDKRARQAIRGILCIDLVNSTALVAGIRPFAMASSGICKLS